MNILEREKELDKDCVIIKDPFGIPVKIYDPTLELERQKKKVSRKLIAIAMLNIMPSVLAAAAGAIKVPVVQLIGVVAMLIIVPIWYKYFKELQTLDLEIVKKHREYLHELNNITLKD